MEILTIPMTPFATNCYVVRSGNEAIVIDPGDVLPELIAAVKDYTVSYIINTHAHCDHCGGNAELKRQTGARLAIHRDDLPLLRSLREQGAMFGLPFSESPPPDVFLDETDRIAVGSVSFEVKHTPGHSPGHIVLLGDTCAFVGDLIFAGSVGRTDLPGGNHAALLNSIEEKIMVLDDDVVLYSGHGSPTTVGAEKRANPFLARNGWTVL